MLPPECRRQCNSGLGTYVPRWPRSSIVEPEVPVVERAFAEILRIAAGVEVNGASREGAAVDVVAAAHEQERAERTGWRDAVLRAEETGGAVGEGGVRLGARAPPAARRRTSARGGRRRRGRGSTRPSPRGRRGCRCGRGPGSPGSAPRRRSARRRRASRPSSRRRSRAPRCSDSPGRARSRSPPGGSARSCGTGRRC